MPLLASLATIPAEITLLSFTKENKTKHNSQLFHIALIKRKMKYLEPPLSQVKGMMMMMMMTTTMMMMMMMMMTIMMMMMMMTVMMIMKVNMYGRY